MRTTKLHPDDVEHIKREIEFARRAGQQINGIYYCEELAGPGGMDYMLVAAEGTAEKAIEEAENYLRQNQDVVEMYVMFVPPEMVADDDRDKPSPTEEEKIRKIRDVKENGYNKVDGVALDGFSASAIIAVYDALNEQNKRKFAALSIPKMASVAFKFVK